MPKIAVMIPPPVAFYMEPNAGCGTLRRFTPSQLGAMIRYRIDQKNHCVFVQNTGVCTTEAILSHLQNMVADPDYQPGMNEIIDLRYLDVYDVDSEGIRQVIAQEARSKVELTNTRTAFICATDVVFGMLRMFQTLASDLGNDIQVFRDAGPAFEFVGIDSREEAQLQELLLAMESQTVPHESDK